MKFTLSPQKLFYGLLTTLLLVGLGGIALYGSVRATLHSNLGEISSRQADLEIISDKAKILNDAKLQLEELKDINIEERIKLLLPEGKNQAEAIENLVTIFERVGVSLSGISFEETEENPSATSQSTPTDVSAVRALPLDLEYNRLMSYEQAKNLISSLQASSRHVVITNLSLTPAATRGGAVQLDLSVSVQFSATEAANSNNGEGKTKEEILKEIEERNAQDG